MNSKVERVDGLRLNNVSISLLLYLTDFQGEMQQGGMAYGCEDGRVIISYGPSHRVTFSERCHGHEYAYDSLKWLWDKGLVDRAHFGKLAYTFTDAGIVLADKIRAQAVIAASGIENVPSEPKAEEVATTKKDA